MIEPTEDFRRAAADLGIAFDSGDLERLGGYLERLFDANTKFNLTAVTDPAEAWQRHVLDSLTLLPAVVAAEAASVIDVGSGGGLPGVPLAIALHSVRFTLLEATGKKARFLQETVAALGLSNVEVVSERAETAGQDRERYRERFDVAVARAVGRLPVLLELAAPLVRVGGHIAVIKGERAADEIKEARRALELLHCQVVSTTRNPTGTVVLIQKLQATAQRYARRPGEPGRRPL